MSIFVSYDSIDISHVNSLSNINKQNSTLKRKKLWIAFEKKSGVKNIPPGEEYIKEIQSNIKSSKGAVLFVSKNFLKNDFINTYELPLIIDKWKTDKNYKILPIFVDAVSIPNESIVSKIQFINSPNTSLSTLKGSQYTLVLEEVLQNLPGNFSLSASEMLKTINNYIKKIVIFKKVLKNYKYLITGILVISASIFILNNYKEEIKFLQNDIENSSTSTSKSTITTITSLETTTTVLKYSNLLLEQIYSNEVSNSEYLVDWPLLFNLDIEFDALNRAMFSFSGENIGKIMIEYSNGCIFESGAAFKRFFPNNECTSRKYTKNEFLQNVRLKNITIKSNNLNIKTQRPYSIILFNTDKILTPAGYLLCCHKLDYLKLERQLSAFFENYFINDITTTVAPTTTVAILKSQDISLQASVGYQSLLEGKDYVTGTDFDSEFIYMSTNENCTYDIFVENRVCRKFLNKFDSNFSQIFKIDLFEKFNCLEKVTTISTYLYGESLLITCRTDGGLKLIRLSLDGNLIWEKTLIPKGRSGDYVLTTQNTLVIYENYIYLTVNSTSQFTDEYFGEQESYIFKFNSDGDIVWIKNISTIRYDQISDILVNDSGIFICNNYNSGNYSPTLIKLNFLGEKIWESDIKSEERITCENFYVSGDNYYVRIISNQNAARFIQFNNDGILGLLDYKSDISHYGAFHVIKGNLVIFGTVQPDSVQVGKDLGGPDLFYSIYSNFGGKNIYHINSEQFGSNFDERTWGFGYVNNLIYIIGVTDGSLFGEKLNSDQDYFVQKFLILDS